jgi:glycine/D-amino acid oxidase-like deaminating enzyme/nitrite reductase/ring-hydroxylating ferredoxin subunit
MAGMASGSTTSVWATTATVPQYGPLTSDARADVCVVGAGIAGLITAYHLAREGRDVLVIDHAEIGGGESGRTTAHLANAMDDRFIELEKVHGVDGSRLAARSHGAAIDRVEAIIAEEGIDCDFRRVDGYLFLAPEHDEDLLARELEAAQRAGLTDVERLARLPVQSFDAGPCLRFPRQGQFHPLKFLAGLARAIERHGGRIRTGTHVIQTEDGNPATVRTSGGITVRADDVVLATNSPAGHYLATLKMLPYRTFAIAMRVDAGVIPTALYWDTGDPYYYLRLQPVQGGEVLIVGGLDHQTGTKDDAEERFDALERWARERFATGDVGWRWSGQVLEPADYLGFIGLNPGEDHVYIATGDSGQGMTHGVIAGMLIPDLIAGRPNEWTDLYSPSRIKPGAVREYLAEAFDVGIRYLDYLKPGADPDSIERGQGAIIRRGLTPVAAYRDEDGYLHRHSAVCTHAGCVVRWNSTEKTWDCPCHGSRFDPLGSVINGPAAAPLRPIED